MELHENYNNFKKPGGNKEQKGYHLHRNIPKAVCQLKTFKNSLISNSFDTALKRPRIHPFTVILYENNIGKN